MNLFSALFRMQPNREASDYDKIRVTSNGGFYMPSEDIFDNKAESLDLLDKLDESLVRHTAAAVVDNS